MAAALALALVVTAGAAAHVPSASNALFLLYSRDSAPPGAHVAIRTTGQAPRGQTLRVYIVRREFVMRIAFAGDRRLVFLGELSIGPDGIGRLDAVVPAIGPGWYTSFVDCVGCGGLGFAGPFPGSFHVLAG